MEWRRSIDPPTSNLFVVFLVGSCVSHPFLRHSAQSRDLVKRLPNMASQTLAPSSVTLCSDFISAWLASFPSARRFLDSVAVGRFSSVNFGHSVRVPNLRGFGTTSRPASGGAGQGGPSHASQTGLVENRRDFTSADRAFRPNDIDATCDYQTANDPGSRIPGIPVLLSTTLGMRPPEKVLIGIGES
jgi:hypothetical protein